MNKEIGKRVRPWTQGPSIRRRRDRLSIALPATDIYHRHMEHVQSLHNRLQLTEPRRSFCLSPRSSSSLASLQRPGITRSHTFTAVTSTTACLESGSALKQFQERSHNGLGRDPQIDDVDRPHSYSHHEDMTVNNHVESIQPRLHIRPLAYSYPLSSDQTESIRYVGRKYAWTKSKTHTKKASATKKVPGKEDEASSSGVSSDDENLNVRGKEHVRVRNPPRYDDANGASTLSQGDPMDILQLCEHLRTKGLGDPVLSIHSHKGPQRNSLPPGVKARCLPRNPSTREKIKGQARLDQELANLKAMAFCEQQRPRPFRTASADLRNRDMRHLEEEERENMQRDMNEVQAMLGDEVVDEDDDSSLMGSPFSREELFLRIEAWADDVQNALTGGEHSETHR